MRDPWVSVEKPNYAGEGRVPEFLGVDEPMLVARFVEQIEEPVCAAGSSSRTLR